MNPVELLEWFDTARRDLPWRRGRDPWSVLVSEVMLQQTQVDRVVSYWTRFMETFPDVRDCAGASLDQVLARWSGLGYYRRARQLHAAAQVLVHQGAPTRWPASSQEWQKLPGIGAYTAAALGSTCCGEVVAAIDGNVERVVGRWLGLAGPYGAEDRRRIRDEATASLSAERPGDGNQALIELGALICRPEAPRCDRCPARSRCVAAASPDPASYRPKRARRETVEFAITVVVVRRLDSVLLVRRARDRGLLDDLWELPWFESEQVSQLSRYGVDFRLGAKLGEVQHHITFRRITATVRRGDAEATPAGAQWVPLEELEHFGMSSLVGKALALADRGPLIPGNSRDLR